MGFRSAARACTALAPLLAAIPMAAHAQAQTAPVANATATGNALLDIWKGQNPASSTAGATATMAITAA